MRYSNYLTEIAALIRQDPSITVREIAAELKFADSKSIYYWLEKGNIKGINEFKRMVLAEERPQPEDYVLRINDQTRYLVKIPFREWGFQREKTPAEWGLLYHKPQPKGLFAIRVGTGAFGPWFQNGDILIVKEAAIAEENDWVLLKSNDEFIIAKTINNRIVHLQDLERFKSPYKVVGVILSQERHFS